MAGDLRNPIEPGSMKWRVTFYRQGEVTDALGKITNGYTEVITLWADLYPIRGQEFYEVQRIQGKVTHKCYCRWHSALAEIDSTWFLSCRGKKYSIESAVDTGLSGRFMEIYCTEHVDKEDVPTMSDEGIALIGEYGGFVAEEAYPWMA